MTRPSATSRSLSLFALLSLVAVAAAAPALSGCDPGCLNGDDCSNGPWNTPASVDMAHPACATTCAGGCASGQSCITPAAITGDHAFCAAACADDRDCAAGSRCLTLFAAMQPSSCVADSATLGCTSGGSSGACDTQASCDGSVALVRFADATRGICGWERTFCANGCTLGACNP